MTDGYSVSLHALGAAEGTYREICLDAAALAAYYPNPISLTQLRDPLEPYIVGQPFERPIETIRDFCTEACGLNEPRFNSRSSNKIFSLESGNVILSVDGPDGTRSLMDFARSEQVWTDLHRQRNFIADLYGKTIVYMRNPLHDLKHPNLVLGFPLSSMFSLPIEVIYSPPISSEPSSRSILLDSIFHLDQAFQTMLEDKVASPGYDVKSQTSILIIYLDSIGAGNVCTKPEIHTVNPDVYLLTNFLAFRLHLLETLIKIVQEHAVRIQDTPDDGPVEKFLIPKSANPAEDFLVYRSEDRCKRVDGLGYSNIDVSTITVSFDPIAFANAQAQERAREEQVREEQLQEERLQEKRSRQSNPDSCGGWFRLLLKCLFIILETILFGIDSRNGRMDKAVGWFGLNAWLGPEILGKADAAAIAAARPTVAQTADVGASNP